MELTCSQRKKPGNGYGLGADWVGILILVWTGDTDGVVAGTCYEMASWEHHPLFGFGLGHL